MCSSPLPAWLLLFLAGDHLEVELKVRVDKSTRQVRRKRVRSVPAQIPEG